MGPPAGTTSNRSCDPCRQRKIKCDKRNPCQQCVRSFHDCAFSEPHRKKRQRLPLRRIEELESRLQLVEFQVSRGDEPTHRQPQNAHRQQDRLPGTSAGATNVPRRERLSSSFTSADATAARSGRSGDAEPAPNSRFIIDSEGVDFLGSSGDRAFLETCREKPSNWPDYAKLRQNAPPITRMPDLLSPERVDFPNFPLPAKRIALRLVDAAFDSHSTLPILDQAHFFSTLESIYALKGQKCTTQQQRFIPLLYSVLALGCLSLKPNVEGLGREATVDKGVEYLRLARQLVNFVACKDLTTLQAVIMMNFCYIATSRSHLCYTYLCATLTLATRMGLHQDYTATYHHKDVFPRGLSKLSFCALRLLLADTATCCGLPVLMDEVSGEQDPPPSEDNESTRLFRRLYHIRVKPESPELHEQATSFGSEGARAGVVEATREAERQLDEWLCSLPGAYRGGMSDPARTFTRDRLNLAIGYAYRLGFVYRPALQLALYDLDEQSPAYDQASARRYATIAILASQSTGLLCEAVLSTDVLTSIPILVPRVLFSSVITLFRVLLTLHSRVRPQSLLQSVIANTLTLQKLATTNILAQTYFHTFLGIISTLPAEFARVRAAILQACDGMTTSLPDKGPNSPAWHIDINGLVTEVFGLSRSEQLSQATADYFQHPKQALDKGRPQGSKSPPDQQSHHMMSDIHPKAAKTPVPVPIGSHMIHYTYPYGSRHEKQPMYLITTELDQQPMLTPPPPPPPNKIPDKGDGSGGHQQGQDLLMLDLPAPLAEDLDMGFLEMNGSFTADVGQGFSFCDWL